MVTSTRPNLATIDILLRDGYWDRTEIISMLDGTQRVRKQSKGHQSAGPWVWITFAPRLSTYKI